MVDRIPLFKVFMADDAHRQLYETLYSGYIGQGPKVDEFERQFGNFIGNPRVSAVNSGTSAIHLALHMYKQLIHNEFNHPERNEVLATPLTCLATNMPIVANGLKIKWVDVDPNTCNMDLKDLARKISDKTFAILVVHWGGYPVDLDELKEVTRAAFTKFGHRFIPVIEDCAHALGSTYKGNPLGSYGNTCCYSFQAIKHLTTGDGGAVSWSAAIDSREANKARWYGLDRTSSQDFRCSQNVQSWGYKFHMNDLAATIGLANLEHTKRIVETHKENATWMLKELTKDYGLIESGWLRFLEHKFDRESAYWVLTLRVKHRDRFIEKMKERGVDVGRVHDRNDKHDCFKEFRALLPGTDEICSDMVCIPCGWWIGEAHRTHIVDSIRGGW